MAGEGIRVQVPFCLATALIMLTKLLRPVVALLRQQVVRLVMYLKNILVMAETHELLQTHLQLTMSLLTNLGFMLNLSVFSHLADNWSFWVS